MYTEKENFIRTIKNDNPDRLCNDFDAMAFCPDPIFWMDRIGVVPMQKPGDYYKDTWGTTIVHPEGHPGPMPIVNAENAVIKNIENWKEELCVPDYESYDLDWTEVKSLCADVEKEDKQLTMTLMIVGLFERTHYLMGFEDALMNHLLYPDEMHELLDVLLESKMQQTKVLLDNCHFDVILHHDDWGSKDQLFLPPDVWREFYKDRYKKLFDYIKSRGVIIAHHGDSFHEPIAQDMVDIGIDVWQGVLPQNDIPKLQKELNGSMTLMGGIDAGIVDRVEVDEAVIRKEVRRACEEYGPAGGFIPSLTYGGPGSIFDGVSAIIHDEIVKYNEDVYGIGEVQALAAKLDY